MKSLLSVLLVSAAVAATPALAASDVVTIYSADGLHDGKGSWFETQFDAFTKATGVKVQYVEAGSGGVVERVAKEKSNPQADVLVTLPPFIQRAEAQGLLQKFTPAAAAEISGGSDSYQPLVDNYLSFIYNSAALKSPPATYDELLDPKFKGKIQYSTPGQAGDGTAVMLQVIHSYGGKDCGLRVPEEAADQQRRSVRLDRQADRAGQQGRALCRQWRRADEHVADGRRSEYPRVLARGPERRAFRAAAALLHRPGRRRPRRRQRQEADRLPALQGSPGDRLLGCDRRSGAQGRRRRPTPTTRVFRRP